MGAIFNILAVPLGWLLHFIYQFIPNYFCFDLFIHPPGPGDHFPPFPKISEKPGRPGQSLLPAWNACRKKICAG